MAGALKKYIERVSPGRKTGRRFVTSVWNIPEPMTGAEWQVILASARPKELQRSPDFKDVFRSAIDNGAAVITMEAS